MEFRTLADIESFEQVPAEDRWRGKSTYEIIARSAAKFPERPAFKFQFTADVNERPLVVTYRTLLRRLHQTANALHAGGVAVGGVTSILLPSLPETHYALWGAQALGIVGPVNPMLEPEAIKDILIHSDTTALVVAGPKADGAIWDKVSTIIDHVPGLKLVLQVNGQNAPNPAPTRTAGGVEIMDFDQAIAAQNDSKMNFIRDIQPGDIAGYFHTGGTTGRPKVAQHSQANQVHLASMMVDFLNLDENTVAIGGLPLFHVNSFFNAGINVLACGGHAVFFTPDGFRSKSVIENFWRLSEKYRATYVAMVPTVVSALLDVPIEDADLSAFEFMICGAAPISPQVFAKFQDMAPIEVIEGYGMTEGTMFSAGNPLHGEKRVGSIGIRVPYQQMKTVILDENSHYVRDCETNEIGTIVIKGPNVFPGYKDPKKNTDIFIQDGWLISADLAREDADGYFWMTGRSKDLIIRGGHNIDPQAIEDVLCQHPSISLAAAVGQPDAYAGELPCAFVTLNEGLDVLPSGDEIRAFAKANIAERAASPVHIEILDAMPVTAVGKIFKPDLRARAIARVFNEAIIDDAPSAVLTVDNNPSRGLVARVSNIPVAALETVRAKLDTFTTPYDLTVGI
ncbi:MAG: acyl-CoA synthetase [Pseudomonadota bacterium]